MRNRAKCRNCETVIESVHVHDMVACECYKHETGNTGIWIDGGTDYSRIGGNLSNFLWVADDDSVRELRLKLIEEE